MKKEKYGKKSLQRDTNRQRAREKTFADSMSSIVDGGTINSQHVSPPNALCVRAMETLSIGRRLFSDI
jgi:hypothetical protein